MERMNMQILVTVPEEAHLLDGLILPPVVSKLLPKNCLSLKLVDFQNRKFYIRTKHLRDEVIKIHGADWPLLVRSYPYGAFGQLCLTWHRKRTFFVQFYSDDGIEYKHFLGTDAFGSACLIRVSPATFSKQAVDKLVLWDLNGNQSRAPEEWTYILGQASNCIVKVFHDKLEVPGDVKLAAGFEGQGWNAFCNLNQVQIGFIIKITNLKNLTFKVDVFNAEGISLDLARIGQEIERYRQLSLASADEETAAPSNHRCRYFHRNHRIFFGHFFVTLPSDILETNLLAVPKLQVARHKMVTYHRAILHFRNLVFTATLEVGIVRDAEDAESQLVMFTDWSHFMEQTGVSVGDVLRFQMNPQKGLVGEVMDLDVC